MDNSAIKKRLESTYEIDFPDTAEGFDLVQVLTRFFNKAKPDVQKEDLNARQRLVVLAEQFDKRISLVIDWLNRQEIDISAWQYEKFVVGNETLFAFSQVIPVPDPIRPNDIGRLAKKPWLKDGREYHLNSNCGDMSRDLLLALEESIGDTPEVAIKWTQKLYVKLIGPSKREVRVYTGTSKKRLDVLFMHAPVGEADAVLAGTGVNRMTAPEFYWYDKSSPWFKLESPESLSETLKQQLRDWLI